MSIETHIALRNNISELNTLATTIDEFAKQANIGKKLQFYLNLALDELVTNIISYGYIDDNDHQIHVTLCYNDSQFSVTLVDDGKPFDPTKLETPDLESDVDKRKIGGLGIYFVKTLMDKMEYKRIDNCNHLFLAKNI